MKNQPIRINWILYRMNLQPWYKRYTNSMQVVGKNNQANVSFYSSLSLYRFGKILLTAQAIQGMKQAA